MNNDRASFPALPPPPFDPPVVLEARKITGLVVLSNNDVNYPPTLLRPNDDDNDDNNSESHRTSPPQFERTETSNGNVLLIDDTDEGLKRQYLIQRKLRSSIHGSTRVGYVLEDPNSDTTNTSNTCFYKVKGKENNKSDKSSSYEMVTVKIIDKSSIECNNNNNNSEISALRIIALHHQAEDDPGKQHSAVEGTTVIGADRNHIYAIIPCYYDCSLFDYCSTLLSPRTTNTNNNSTGHRYSLLSEIQAFHIFDQILQVREKIGSILKTYIHFLSRLIYKRITGRRRKSLEVF